MNKTGKITFITPKGKSTPFKDKDTGEEIINNKYLVGFADGTQYTFSARENFLYPVGSEISFIVSNEQYKTAKGAKRLTNTVPSTSQTKSNNFQDNSTSKQIRLLAIYNKNMEVFGKENRDSIKSFILEDYKFITETLNKEL